MVDTPESLGTGGGSPTPPRDRLQPGDPAVTEIVTMAASLLDTVTFRARKRDQSTLAKGPELELLQSVYVLQSQWLARREAQTIRTSASHEEIASEAKRLLGRELVLSATQVSKFAANWNTALKDGIKKRGSSNDRQYEGAVTFRYDGGNGRSAFWFDLAEVIQHEGEPERTETVIRTVRFTEPEVPLTRLLDETAADPPYEKQGLAMLAAAKKGHPKALSTVSHIKRAVIILVLALMLLGSFLLPAEGWAWIVERLRDIHGWIETDVTPTPVDRAGSYQEWTITEDDSRIERKTSLAFQVQKAEIAVPRRALRAVVSGKRLYVAGDEGLRIYGLRDPTKPALLGTLTFTVPAVDVAVLGSVAFVATGHEGVAVVDVSNPAAPTVRTRLPKKRRIDVSMTLAGTRLFVTSGGIEGGLRSYDVRTPTAPILEGSTEIGPAGAVNVAVVGRFAYVTEQRVLGSGGGLVVVDIGQPENPRVVGTLDTSNRDNIDMKVVGPYAYFAVAAGLLIVDVSNPAKPTTIGVLPTVGSATAVAVQGSTAYIGTAAQPAAIRGLTMRMRTESGELVAYPGTEVTGGITVADISVPTQPVSLRTLASPCSTYDIVLGPGVAYAAGDGALTVLTLPEGL